MKKLILLIVCGFTLIPAFQNCTGGGFHSDLNSVNKDSLLSFSPMQVGATLDWSMKSLQPEASRLSQVSKWSDATGQGISLYPPVLAGTSILNLDAAPLLNQTDNGNLLAFGPGLELINEVGDLSAFLGQAYSISIYVRNIQLSTTTGGGGVRLFDFYPADGSASGYLGIQIGDVGGGNVEIQAFDYFDNNDVSYSIVTMPAASLTGGFGMVVRFSNDPTKILLSVNGTPGTYSIAGSPPLLGNVTRQLVLHGYAYNQLGSFMLGDFAIWNSELTDTQVNTYSNDLMISYNQGGSGGGPTPTPTPTPTPSQTGTPQPTYTYLSQNLFGASGSNCVGCHSAPPGDSGGYDFSSYTAITTGGGISTANPSASPIYQQIQSGNMPQGGAHVSAAIQAALLQWIQNGAQNN